MAISNERGWLVLTTGNKSEMAVGYATLYGDMAGGYAVLIDVPKTLVYELCEHRNTSPGTDLVPRAVIDKPPSAELRPDQRDDQSSAALLGARPDPRGLRRAGPHRLRSGRRRVSTPPRCAG